VAAAKAARDRNKHRQKSGILDDPEPPPTRNRRPGLFSRSEIPSGPLTGMQLRMADLMENQEKVRKIYTGLRVQAFVALLIGGNFLVNVIEKQLDPKGDQGMEHIWAPWELFFNIAFTLELMVNFYAHCWRAFWRSGWNIFDLLVVSIGILTTVFKDLPGPLKLLRIIRAFRVFRLFKRVKSLNRIMVSLTRAVPGVANAFLILVLVMSIYSILGVDLFREHGKGGIIHNEANVAVEYLTPRGQEYGDEYFGNFLKAWYTMFQVLTTESWNEAVGRPLVHQRDSVAGFGCAMFFTSFSVIVAIVLVNVMVAVLLEKMVDDENPAPGAEEEEESAEDIRRAADKAAEDRLSRRESGDSLDQEDNEAHSEAGDGAVRHENSKAEEVVPVSEKSQQSDVKAVESASLNGKENMLGDKSDDEIRSEVSVLKADIGELRSQLQTILSAFQKLPPAGAAFDDRSPSTVSPTRYGSGLRVTADASRGETHSSLSETGHSIPGYPHLDATQISGSLG